MAKSAAQRKQEQRKRDAEHLLNVGAQELKMHLYGGTCKVLDAIVAAGEFEEREEAITVLIHNVGELIYRDRHAFDKLTDVTSLRKPSSA